MTFQYRGAGMIILELMKYGGGTKVWLTPHDDLPDRIEVEFHLEEYPGFVFEVWSSHVYVIDEEGNHRRVLGKPNTDHDEYIITERTQLGVDVELSGYEVVEGQSSSIKLTLVPENGLTE